MCCTVCTHVAHFLRKVQKNLLIIFFTMFENIIRFRVHTRCTPSRSACSSLPSYLEANAPSILSAPASQSRLTAEYFMLHRKNDQQASLLPQNIRSSGRSHRCATLPLRTCSALLILAALRRALRFIALLTFTSIAALICSDEPRVSQRCCSTTLSRSQSRFSRCSSPFGTSYLIPLAQRFALLS